MRFSDGSTARYDLVIAADGLNSATRAAIGITAKPEPTGMAIWRTTAPRPAGLVRTDLAYGGPAYIMRLLPDQRAHPVRLRRRGVPRPRRHRPGLLRRRDAAGSRGDTAATGPRSPRTSRTRRTSTTPGSTDCWSRAPGTAAGWCSSATPRTAARPPSRRARPCPWRTPPSSPNSSPLLPGLGRHPAPGVLRAPHPPGAGGRRGVRAARAVATGRRPGRRRPRSDRPDDDDAQGTAVTTSPTPTVDVHAHVLLPEVDALVAGLPGLTAARSWTPGATAPPPWPSAAPWCVSASRG